MRALQILFLISFAILALVVPFLVFSSVQGGNSNTVLIILIAVIFIVNAVFIGRKLLNLRKEK